MDYTGSVKKLMPSTFATFTVTEGATFLTAVVSVGGTPVITFPMKKGIDQNEIGNRISNVINQTGFVDETISIEFD